MQRIRYNLFDMSEMIGLTSESYFYHKKDLLTCYLELNLVPLSI